MAGGHASIARLVHYSPEIKRIFQEFASASESTVLKAVSNFRAAQHRFDSQSKPLGRTCLFLHACVRTALHLTRARSDNVMRKARNFLLWLNDERALQAAMLAGAADSSKRLTTIVLGGGYNPAYTLGYNPCYNQDRITFPLSYLS